MVSIVGTQHAVGYVSGEQYYGAKASINVWAPKVSNQYEFSLSQMWVISGSLAMTLTPLKLVGRYVPVFIFNFLQFFFSELWEFKFKTFKMDVELLLGRIYNHINFIFRKKCLFAT